MPKLGIIRSAIIQRQCSTSATALVDKFNRRHDYLRISLTERCNLRCFYCMPPNGVQLSPAANLLTAAEIHRLAALFVHRFGVRKIRLTGGEPLIRADIADILAGLSRLKSRSSLKTVAMTTNGLVFWRHSRRLRDAGLDSVNISLDTLRPDRFERITRRAGLERVLRSIDVALGDGYDPVKINCVPIRGVNDDEIGSFIAMIRDRPNLEIRFIEFMPFGGNDWQRDRMLSAREILTRIDQPVTAIEPESPNDTARRYRVDGHQGTLGIISSMTKPFCGGCNRLRITADGNLKVCLFDRDEVSLRDALRTGNDQTVTKLIREAVHKKRRQHGGQTDISGLAAAANRPMILIDHRQRIGHRPFSTFSHLDRDGQLHMVDIGSKQQHTDRQARARCHVLVGPEVWRQIADNRVAKGNVLSVAHTAAIMAAKRTDQLIPLCHQIPLDQVDVQFRLQAPDSVVIETICRAHYKTGVEMEALVAASVAALTIYDMCKSINRAIVIQDCRLIAKSGGKSPDFEIDEN